MSRAAVLKQDYESDFDTAICEIMAGNKSIDELDKILEDAKKNCYDEILEINNAAYQRYLKRLEK